MKKHYLIMVVWYVTLYGTDPILAEVTQKSRSTNALTQLTDAMQKIEEASAANVPGTLLMRDEQGNFSAHIITADLQGNAATANQAQQATHATQADKATSADTALQANQADKAAHALQSDHAVQADQAVQAQTFTEPLSGDVIGNQNSTIVRSVGGQSATTIATAVQQIQQATSECSNNMVVCRDAQGDFSARNIKARLLGNATTATNANTFNKALEGDVVGKQFNTVVQTVGGQSAVQIATAVQKVQSATTQSSPQTIVSRDASGDFEAHIITADLQGNAATATYATHAGQAEHASSANQAQQATYATQADKATHALQSDHAARADQAEYANQATQALHANTFTESLAGDVIGSQQNTVVHSVGGQSAEIIAAAVQKLELATSVNTSGSLIMRDASGNFSAHIITADLQGNATTANRATQATHALSADQALQAQSFTEPLSGDVRGNQGTTVVHSVGGQSAVAIAAVVQQVQQATSEWSNNMLVRRDAKGDFSARNINATLLGNATSATQAHTFNKALEGDVVGKQFNTVVQTVGGQSAAQIATAVQMVQSATTQSSPQTIVSRDASGDFAAHIITADLQGNAATATHAITADTVTHATNSDYATQAINATTADRAIQADKATHALQSDHAARADQAEYANQATQAQHANTFTEPLSGDVIGNQGTTIVRSVGGQSATTIATAVQQIQQATSECSNNMVVCRDAQGDFSARNIKARLLGNATTAIDANTFNKALEGDVVGKQFNTVVCSVGGQSAAQIATTVQKVCAAALENKPNTLVMRDAQGDFAAHIITADLQGNAASATQAQQAAHAAQADKATSALCAQTFTEPLNGDVVGGQQNTVVATIGGCTAEQVAAAVQKIETTSLEEKVITYITDAGNAIPKASKLGIRGGHNIKIRGSDSSVVISLVASPSVTGSLTAGTTVTAGTGLHVVSGGASITGDTKINIAGNSSTILGNPSSSIICNGPLCCKHVSIGEGTPLGIDADGNLVMISDTRMYHELIDTLVKRYPVVAHRSPCELSVVALLRVLVAVIGEQQKRLESIENHVKMN